MHHHPAQCRVRKPEGDHKPVIIALPVELPPDQNIALMRQFVVDQVPARGQVADWVYHDEPGNRMFT